MSKRSNTKRVTRAARVLRFLREQTGLSIRKAAARAGIGDGVIAHLEQGRMDLREKHLERLLPAYKCSRENYELFLTGKVQLPENVRWECIEILKTMTSEQVRTVHPMLSSFAGRAIF